jgi:predicted  nucleic acid-binding Zn-ribbon protein
LRDKVREKTNKINFLHLKSLELSEIELLEQLDEYKKILKACNKKKSTKEKDLSKDKARQKTLNEAMNKVDLEGQKFKEQLSALNKQRATLKVMSNIESLKSRILIMVLLG